MLSHEVGRHLISNVFNKIELKFSHGDKQGLFLSLFGEIHGRYMINILLPKFDRGFRCIVPES